jgi:hypothetical protein
MTKMFCYWMWLNGGNMWNKVKGKAVPVLLKHHILTTALNRGKRLASHPDHFTSSESVHWIGGWVDPTPWFLSHPTCSLVTRLSPHES